MKKEFSATLTKIMMIGVLLASILIYVVIPKDVDAKSKEAKYGTSESNEKEAEERRAAERSQELASQHESGMANGTAGDTISPGVTTSDGKTITSDVSGCYNTRKFGGSFAIRTDMSADLNSAVNVGAGESSYAYVMDSSCGAAAKGALYTAAATLGYPAGPILDINIGKKDAAGQIVYPDSFSGANGGVFMNYNLPAGYRMAGYEPAFICLLPDGTTELVPNIAGGTDICGIFVDHPKGVYMLTQVPAGSIKATQDQYLLKHFNNYFHTNYSSLSAFGPNV